MTTLSLCHAAGMVTEAFSDFVVGHGELWCAQLFNATLRKMGVDSAFMDSRDVLVVTATSDGNSVDVEYEDSNQQLDRWAQKHGSPAVSALSLQGCPGQFTKTQPLFRFMPYL